MMGEVIRVSGRAPDIGEFLREAMMSQRFADVALCCPGGPKFLAHRLVLSAASPYLQEVLVAHGRANGYYEPITIILAEVEAPELAALLGFVYTGSATVPRPRLSAFLRAAEALHIKLPPVPVAMTCGEEAGCKQEDVKDVKDVKVNPKYLQCDQYPLYDRWYHQSNRACNPINSSSLEVNDTDEDRSRRLRSQKFRYSPDRHSPRGSIWQIGSMLNNIMTNPTAAITTRENRTLCYPNESNFATVGTRYRVDSRLDPETVDPSDPANFNSIARKSLIGSHAPASPNVYNSQVVLEEKLKANYDTRGITVPLRALSRKTFYDESEIIRRHCNGGSRDSGGGVADETTTDSGANPPSFVNHPARPATATATATNYVGGEDLTCRETCCRWRAPKRHVANRVTASPWRQIVRPHHSPKQPMVHHHQPPENLEVRNPVTVPEAVRIHGATAALINPEDRLVPEAFKADHHHHHHQVSYGGYEVSYDANAIKEPITTMAVVDSPPSGPRFQEPVQHQEQLYRPRLPPFPARAKSTATGFFQSPGNHLESVQPLPPPPPPAITLSNSLENWEPVPSQIPQKPELSHPISRLCDTLESSEKRESFESRRVIEERKIGEIISKEEEAEVEENEEEEEQEQEQEQEQEEEVEEEVEEEEGTEEKEKKKNERLLLLSDRNNNNSNSNSNNNNNNNNNNSSSSDKSDTRKKSESSILLAIDETGRNPGGGSQEDHKCDQCGKSFVTRASLKVHGRTHSGEKPFRCADCGKQFSQLRNYKYHRSVHEGTREFAATCPECGKYFNDRGYLSSHMKIHRNRKEYGCTECGKSFNQRVAYNMHVRIHTGVKPHQCDQCGKAFSRKMLLKQHLRTHSGERPYQCQVCQKAFADRSNMTLHTRLHSGLKPYQCTLCSKAFTKKHHLKTHLNYHTGTKPYSCPNCALRFSQSSNMRTHYKKCTINNPAGVKSEHARVADEKTMIESSERIASTTDTLTPPTSDQESTSSILTPPVVAAKLPSVQSPLKL